LADDDDGARLQFEYEVNGLRHVSESLAMAIPGAGSDAPECMHINPNADSKGLHPSSKISPEPQKGA